MRGARSGLVLFGALGLGLALGGRLLACGDGAEPARAVEARTEEEKPAPPLSSPAWKDDLRLIDVRRLSGDVPHSAFTDLARFRGEWVCVFREGKGHVSPDGAIRILASKDGEHWASIARLTASDADLRDPKLYPGPGEKLFIVAAAALHDSTAVRHRTRVWSSKDGREWSAPRDVGDPNIWIWRVNPGPKDAMLAVGYSTVGPSFVRLYETRDGVEFRTVLEKLAVSGSPNESAIVFAPNGEATCLLRRDPENGVLGRSSPPYREWTWRELDRRIGGPELLRFDDGRLLAAVRLYDERTRTALGWIDAESGAFREALTLPSGGDTSYPGLVLHEGTIYVSYYSSHEGRTAVYLARVGLGEREKR